MERYRLFEPILKTKHFSFFRAENTETRQTVVIKKLHRQTSWEDILRNKNIALLNHSKIKELATIKQIVKDESSFYCVFDNLELNLETVILGELEKEDIFRIGRAIIQMVIHLGENKILPREIRPSALFISSNYHSIRMAHIEAFANRDLSKLDLVELQDLRYSVPESVLTSKDIDERSLVFEAGLLLAQLILGRPLLNSNTKIHYIFQLTKLFPEERLQHDEKMPSRVSLPETHSQGMQKFEDILGQYNFSNEFISLLREMLKIDRGQRIALGELLQAYDLIVDNEEQFIKQNEVKNVKTQQSIKPNVNQAPLNEQIILKQIELDFEKKPTLSVGPVIKPHISLLPTEQNVDDDAVQPIIIKKSSRPIEDKGHSMPVGLLKDHQQKMSRTTKQQTITSVKRPQLTNYALNEGSNLGVKLGFQPTLFSQHQNDF